MKPIQRTLGHKRFLWGLSIFVFSASTVALVTDPYVMADIALIILGILLMVSGLTQSSKPNTL